MRFEQRDLDVPKSVAVGERVDCSAFVDKWVHIFGTFSATFAVEVSSDGVHWTVVASTSAAVFIEVAPVTLWLRINTTAWTSGAPLAILNAHNPAE